MPEYDKDAYKAQMQARTKDLTDKLESGMKELYDSDKYKDYLKAMSQFHSYSSRNIMLIKLQKPGATRIAGADLWKKKFNRVPKKGEKALYIYAPVGNREPEKKLMEKLDPETGAPLLDKDGKVIMEEMTAVSSGPRFKLVPVFDKSQTVGDPLPELVENLTGNVEHYKAFMDALETVSPLPIVFEPMNEIQDGYCKYGEKIAIREGMSEAQTVCAAVHEINHARLHDKNNPDVAADTKTKTIKEIEAESIAYVVCQHYGIETSPNSFGYLAEYGSRDMSEVKASLDTIRKESNSLISAIDYRFQAVCKERGIDLTEKEPEQAAAKPEPEPSYTVESRIENLAGVDFSFYDVMPDVLQQSEIEDLDVAVDTAAAKAVPTVQEVDEESGAAGINDYPMPDPTISQQEMDNYGYTVFDMFPLRTERALELFNADHTIYLLYDDSTEAMADDSDEIITFGSDGIFGITQADWENSPEYAKRMAEMESVNKESAKESDLLFSKGDHFGIYQLIDSEETRDLRFESIESIENRNLAVDRGNYVLAYTAPLPTSETLEDLYRRFNTEQPTDFTGHSLSVSDVIVIQKDSDVSSHYVDSIGFVELPAFLGMEKQNDSTIQTEAERMGQDSNTAGIDYKSAGLATTDKKEEIPKHKAPIYPFSSDHATKNGEIEDFHASWKINRDCGRAIDQAVSDSNYEMYHYDLKSAVNAVIAEYGADRTAWVLAGNINAHSSDGRLSNANKAWAKEFDTPRPDIFLNTHRAILDGFADRFREATERKPSLLKTLEANERKSKQQSPTMTEPEKGKHKPDKGGR